MTPEQQRIAIAEACGWSNVKIYARPKANQRHSEDMEPICIGSRNLSWGGGSCSVPNYLNDLNAMHEAEKTLTDKTHEEFRLNLYDVIGDDSRLIVSSTASQRAEAFLCTIGKWKESK